MTSYVEPSWPRQPVAVQRGPDSCAGSSVLTRTTQAAQGSVAADDNSRVTGYTNDYIRDDASCGTYELVAGEGAIDERPRRVVLSSDEEEDPPAPKPRRGAGANTGARSVAVIKVAVARAADQAGGTTPVVGVHQLPAPLAEARRPREPAPQPVRAPPQRHDADSAAGVVPRPVVRAGGIGDGASTVGAVSEASHASDLTGGTYSFKSTATDEYTAATTISVDAEATAEARGQGADSFSRFSSETLLSAVGSVIVWLGVLYMVPTVGEPCVEEGDKSVLGFMHFFKGYSLNLLFLQVPSAVGTCIATVLVLDYKTLAQLRPLAEHHLPRNAAGRVLVLLIPRLGLQVVIKYLVSKEASGGVMILMNMVCTYLTPLLWTAGRRKHHHMVTLPVMYIYVVMATLCFVILPKLLTQSPTNAVHYVLGPVIIGIVELIMVVGVAVVMRLCGAWDVRNSSVWARTIFTMFLGFKVMMLTNDRLGAEVLCGTIATLVVVETVLQHMPVESLLRQLPRITGPIKRGCSRVRRCGRVDAGAGAGTADAIAKAAAEDLKKGHHKRANFFNAYMASKKDAVIAPLIALPLMKLVQHNPFPEAVDCATGELLEGVDMEWGRLGVAALTIAACEILPNLVRRFTGSTGMHFLYGPFTVVTPPNMYQRLMMHMNQATVTVFALTLALLLVPGGRSVGAA